MSNDITKLPKWARERIELLERTIRELKAERNAGPESTDTYVDHVTGDSHEERWQPLRKGAQVVFWSEPGYPEYRIGRLTVCWNNKHDAIEVRSSGSGELQIVPSVSNVIFIREVDR